MLSACLLLWEGYRFILTDSRWTLPREFTPPTQRGSELHHLGQHHPGGETETQEEGICLRNQSKSAAQQGRENRPPDCDHVFFLLLQSTRGHGHGRVLRDRCWPHLHCHRLGQYLSPGWLPASLSPPRQVSVVALWLGFSLPRPSEPPHHGTRHCFPLLQTPAHRKLEHPRVWDQVCHGSEGPTPEKWRRNAITEHLPSTRHLIARLLVAIVCLIHTATLGGILPLLGAGTYSVRLHDLPEVA